MHSQTNAALARAERQSFRITTWNCFGMGQSLLDCITAARAPRPRRLMHARVIAECASPDVLCIQELMSRDAEAFFDGLGKHGLLSAFRDHNKPHLGTATMRGSGLGIGARAGLTNAALWRFRPPVSGWDRLARKGALYAQVVLDGGVVDVLTVHLQAGTDEAAAFVRKGQLAQVRALVDAIGSRERPFIVCGDFNIDGHGAARGSAEYKLLASTLGDFVDPGHGGDLPTYHPHPEANSLAAAFTTPSGPQRIDYIFFRAAPRDPLAFEPVSVERVLDQRLSWEPPHPTDDEHAYASDHFGVSATFEYDAG